MITEQEYNALKDKTRVHIFNFQGKAYDPNLGIVNADNASDPNTLTNEQTSAIEAYEFMTMKPSAITCYVSDNRVTTWIGDKLGSIVYSHPIRNTFSRHLGQIVVLGINGILYYGVSSGNNMSCNLRAYKNQARAKARHYLYSD